MELVSTEWLDERGGLHDARVTEVCWVGPHLEVSFDDAWSNERGLSKPEGDNDPGTLVLEDASLKEGELTAADDGWVSGIDLIGDEVRFDFFYCPILVFRVTRVHWRPLQK